MLRKKKISKLYFTVTFMTGFSVSAEREGSKICLMKEGLAQEKCLGKLILKF